MARERSASERPRARTEPSPASRARLTLLLTLAAMAAGCRQTVILDPSANGLDGGSAGTGAAGTGGPNLDAGFDFGGAGGIRFDGGRFDVFGNLCPSGGGPIQVLQVVPRTPDVILSVDRSSAMQAWWGAQTRLQVVEQQVHTMVQGYDHAVRFGYEELPAVSTSGMCGNGQGCCAGSVTPPGQRSRNAIENVLHACDSGGPGCSQPGRPVADALSKINKTYASFGSVTPGHSRYVVLVLGGDPTCGDQGSGTDPVASACDEAKLEVQKLNALGIFTIVVGVGADASTAACLETLALAGGPFPKPLLATTPSALTEALTTNVIIPMAQESCHLDVLTPPVDAKNVSLFFDNDLVPPDPSDGWDFDQGTSLNKITVHGHWCDTLLHASRVELVSGCVPPRR
jgi:hypothetical protein